MTEVVAALQSEPAADRRSSSGSSLANLVRDEVPELAIVASRQRPTM